MNKFWEIKNFIQNESADIYIYNEISSWEGEEVTSAQSFRKDLEALGNVKKINVLINSPGGSVGDGLTIASLLQRHTAYVTAYVDGMACSIASVIACAADKLVMGRSSLLMVHNALTFTYGNSKDLRKQADDLDAVTASLRQMYLMKAGDKLTEEKIKELMDNESWLSAKECIELGLCDEILETNKMVAKLPSKFKGMYNNIPKELLNQMNEVNEMDKVENKETEVVETVEATETVVEVTEEVVKEKTEETVEPIAEETETTEETAPETNEEVVDEKESKIEELEKTIEDLKNEKIELETKLNETNEKVISLNDKVAELQPIVDKYNEKMAKEEEEKNAQLVNEKREYYKNKFEQLGARTKFESEEVQNLINNCIKDDKSMSKLNLMIVDLISVENAKPKAKTEKVADMDNLLVIEDDILSKYGFR